MKKLELVLRNTNNAYVPYVTYEVQEHDVIVDKTDNYNYYRHLKLAALRREAFAVIQDAKLIMGYNEGELKVIFDILQKPGGEEAVVYYANYGKERTSSVFNMYDTELSMVDTFVDYEYNMLFTNVKVNDLSELCVRLDAKHINIPNNTILELMLELEAIGLFSFNKYFALYGKRQYTVLDMVEYMLERFTVEDFRKLINDAIIVDINQFFHTDQTAAEKIISTILFYMEYDEIDIQLATFVREYSLEVELAKKLIVALTQYPVQNRYSIAEVRDIRTNEQLSHGIRLYHKLVDTVDNEVKFSILDLATLPAGREYVTRVIMLYKQFHTVLNSKLFYVFKKLVERPMYHVTPDTIEIIREVNDLFDYIDLGFTESEVIAYNSTVMYSTELKPLLMTIKTFRDLGDSSFEEKYHKDFNIVL